MTPAAAEFETTKWWCFMLGQNATVGKKKCAIVEKKYASSCELILSTCSYAPLEQADFAVDPRSDDAYGCLVEMLLSKKNTRCHANLFCLRALMHR